MNRFRVSSASIVFAWILVFPCALWSVGSLDLVVNHIVSHPEIESYIYITDVGGKGP